MKSTKHLVCNILVDNSMKIYYFFQNNLFFELVDGGLSDLDVQTALSLGDLPKWG